MYWSRDPNTGEKIFVYYRFLKDSVMVLDDSNEEEDITCFQIYYQEGQETK